MSQPQVVVVAPPARRINVPFLAALAIVIALYAVAFLVLRAVMPKELEQMAGTIAALTLGGGAYLQRQIERRLRLPVGPVPTRDGYQKPWWLLLGISIAAIWIAQSASPYFELQLGPSTAFIASISTLLSILLPGMALLVGVLIAQRSDRWALALILIAVTVGWTLANATAPLVIGFATGQPAIPPGVGEPPNPLEAMPTGSSGDAFRDLLSSALPLLVALAMLGYWYGTRTRLQAYLGRLLREVEPADREAIVEMAYDAARARSANSGQRSSGS